MDWNDFKVSSSVHLSNNSSVINLFKLSRDHYSTDTSLQDGQPGLSESDLKSSFNYDKLFENEFFDSSFVNFHKDLQLWDRDKLTVIDIITKRLRSTLHSNISKTSDPHLSNKVTKSLDKSINQTDNLPLSGDRLGLPGDRLGLPGNKVEYEVELGLENELLISWLDKYGNDIPNVGHEGYNIFVENAVKLLKKVNLNPVNFINFMLNIAKLAAGKPQNFMYKYLRLSLSQLEKQAFNNLHYYILNTKNIFINELILNTQMSPLDTLKLVINTSNTIFPSVSLNTLDGVNSKSTDYYFFILYLLFRSGSNSSLNLLLSYINKEPYLGSSRTHMGSARGMYMSNIGDEELDINLNELPPLFKELAQTLSNILAEKFDNVNSLLPQFLNNYPQSNINTSRVNSVSVNGGLDILLSIVYPENYMECDMSLMTREDYLCSGSLTYSSSTLMSKSYELCKSLTQETCNIDATEKDLVDRIVSYAYSIALAGGVMESLRLLMSAVKLPQVQAIGIYFTVLSENSGLFEFEEVNFVSYSLWNFVDQNNKLIQSHTSDELSYLLLLAFNRNRNVSPELKILLSTLLPMNKNVMGVKYCVSENFNDAVSPSYLGSSVTKDGMLLVGPLLQKLIKLSGRRSSAKYAILLLAQYCAYVGLWASAFKCFYCIQDADNCAAVLEACCCYLYDKDDNTKTFSIDDLLVYYTLTKNLSPNNKHVLELRKTFSCIELCVLVKNNKYFEAVSYCRKHKVFDNTLSILRNESHQIYFNALFSYIKALKLLISTGSQPMELMSTSEASNLLDLLEAAYQNTNTDQKLTVEALHTLLTFISINPPK
ncbi:uncharacterized protein TA13040 [Theileria annulata]|uniref:Nuclear pore protein n=1 Tax=Theileria annulata TaxID=5874 RepID=Q4UEB6_THEAN|nr:uncharacterized protein TA13040 [Theileria annulata]CAI74573.1 hypothetical protein TA13040 [Theileria annulata]|eukprot:XP_952305.1 hypothetical protein TA13040 [Theileria annulata]